MNEFNLIIFKNCLLTRDIHIAVSRTLCAQKPYSIILSSRSILLSWSYVQSFINSHNNRLTFDQSYIQCFQISKISGLFDCINYCSKAFNRHLEGVIIWLLSSKRKFYTGAVFSMGKNWPELFLSRSKFCSRPIFLGGKSNTVKFSRGNYLCVSPHRYIRKPIQDLLKNNLGIRYNEFQNPL